MKTGFFSTKSKAKESTLTKVEISFSQGDYAKILTVSFAFLFPFSVLPLPSISLSLLRSLLSKRGTFLVHIFSSHFTITSTESN